MKDEDGCKGSDHSFGGRKGNIDFPLICRLDRVSVRIALCFGAGDPLSYEQQTVRVISQTLLLVGSVMYKPFFSFVLELVLSMEYNASDVSTYMTRYPLGITYNFIEESHLPLFLLFS